jgi:hypothetical protein
MAVFRTKPVVWSSSNRGNSMPKRSPYWETLGQSPYGDHPVDTLVRKRCPLPELEKTIREVTDALVEALGRRSGLWLELEQNLNALRTERQEAYFDLGFEHGHADGEARALRWLLKDDPGGEYHTLARDLLSRTITADLPKHLKLTALLEIAWALAARRD